MWPPPVRVFADDVKRVEIAFTDCADEDRGVQTIVAKAVDVTEDEYSLQFFDKYGRRLPRVPDFVSVRSGWRYDGEEQAPSECGGGAGYRLSKLRDFTLHTPFGLWPLRGVPHGKDVLFGKETVRFDVEGAEETHGALRGVIEPVDRALCLLRFEKRSHPGLPFYLTPPEPKLQPSFFRAGGDLGVYRTIEGNFVLSRSASYVIGSGAGERRLYGDL